MTETPETITTQATPFLTTAPAIGANDQAGSFDLIKAAVFKALTAAGITQVVVTFDGYRDSGQIEDIAARNAEGPVALPKRKITILGTTWL